MDNIVEYQMVAPLTCPTCNEIGVRLTRHRDTGRVDARCLSCRVGYVVPPDQRATTLATIGISPDGRRLLHPATWYPDPADPSQLRWYDGTTWTSATQPHPAPGGPDQATLAAAIDIAHDIATKVEQLPQAIPDGPARQWAVFHTLEAPGLWLHLRLAMATRDVDDFHFRLRAFADLADVFAAAPPETSPNSDIIIARCQDLSALIALAVEPFCDPDGSVTPFRAPALAAVLTQLALRFPLDEGDPALPPPPPAPLPPPVQATPPHHDDLPPPNAADRVHDPAAATAAVTPEAPTEADAPDTDIATPDATDLPATAPTDETAELSDTNPDFTRPVLVAAPIPIPLPATMPVPGSALVASRTALVATTAPTPPPPAPEAVPPAPTQASPITLPPPSGDDRVAIPLPPPTPA